DGIRYLSARAEPREWQLGPRARERPGTLREGPDRRRLGSGRARAPLHPARYRPRAPVPLRLGRGLERRAVGLSGIVRLHRTFRAVVALVDPQQREQDREGHRTEDDPEDPERLDAAEDREEHQRVAHPEPGADQRGPQYITGDR